MSEAVSIVAVAARATTRPPRRFAVLSALAFAAITAVAVGSLFAVHRELTESALARRSAISDLAAATLAEKLDRAVDVAVALATRVRFRDLIEAGRWSEAAAILRDVPGNFPFIERIGLFDPQGTLLAEVPDVSASKRPVLAGEEWFKATLRDGKPVISAIFRRQGAPRRNVFVATAPIRSEAGAIVGVLAAQVPIDGFFRWLAGVDVGEAAIVYVVDQSGALAYHSKLVLEGDPVDFSSVPAVQGALKGARGVEIAVNPLEKQERLSAFSPVARHGWAAVVAEPTAAVFETRNWLLAATLTAYALILAFFVAYVSNRVAWQRAQAEGERRQAFERAQRAEESRLQAQRALARQSERLRILGEIDRATVAQASPRSIAEAAVRPLRELLGVPRAIVNLFDLQAREAVWLAAAGRRRLHAGAPVRYPLEMMGDVKALGRGEPQIVDTRQLQPSAEVEALLASGVRVYMVVPMIAGGELIGAISFGGEQADFSPEQMDIAKETATQLAIAITQARLLERVRRQAEELERRVEERTAELHAANRELESFSYSVSHDLRAPLRAVDGYALMLAEDYGDRLDEEGRRLLTVVRKSAEQMGRLIDDLLKFSQLGRRPLARAPLDMRALAGEVLGELAPSYPNARIELGDLPAAAGDRALLRHVWSNLIGNALKYSANAEAPRIEILGETGAAEWVYSVRDNGAGFDMRYYDKLFNVFQRLHREDEFEGTGVGLAIVQRIVARHGGRVWGEGSVGEGARFCFSLPREG